MQVQVPPGAGEGTVIQTQSPEGLVLQAVVPAGVPPGGTFALQYPLPAPVAGTAAPREDLVALCSANWRMLLLASALIGVAMWYQRSYSDKSQDLTLHNLLAFFVAGAVIAYDWVNLGPTLALKHGAFSAVVAWLLVVPLGGVTFGILSSASFLIFFGAGILLVVVGSAFGPCGCVVGVVCCGLLFSYSVVITDFVLNGSFGPVLVFVIVFFLMRLLVGIRPDDPSNWPYVTEVSKTSKEFQEQCDFFGAACMPGEGKFDFSLGVANLYRVERGSSTSAVEGADSIRPLFHGTQWESAKGIICDGFRLPEKGGMFGKGIYFADCPLKSWRYCFASKALSKLVPKTTGRGGLILMCWVNLGVTREERTAAPGLTGYKQWGFWHWWQGGRGAYDSVVGVEEERGGALRMPEYVVYSPKQIRMAYLFETLQAEPRRRAGAGHGQPQE